MVTIRRTKKKEYKLEDDDGNVIKTYNQGKMVHPDDWEQDAKDAGLDVQPFDYVNELLKEEG